MRELSLSEIKDEVSGRRKKELAQTSVVDPNGLVLARGEGSWTEDGREDLPVSPVVVISLLRAHSSNNKTDENPNCQFTSADGKTVTGNPIIFGHLATKNVAIMGTDDAPLLVVSASGRQTLKASIFLTEFLAAARHFLIKAKGDETKAQGKLMADLPDYFEDTKVDRCTRTGVTFTGDDADAVVKFMTDADWLLLFKAGSKIGKPLVGLSYSAVCWMKVTHTGEKPTSRRALENAKRDNLRVSSPFHVEAASVAKLVRSYVIDDGFTEEGALKHVRSLVTSPLAVGGASTPDEAYVEQLYRYAHLCNEAHTAVEAEADPVKKLLLFRKLSKRLFRPSFESIKRGDDSIAKLTINKLTREEQLKLLNPEPKAKTPKPDKLSEDEETAPSSRSDTSFITVRQFPQAAARLVTIARQPSAGGDPEKQRERAVKTYAMSAVAATLAFLSGDDKALADYPEIESALRSSSSGIDALTELKDSLESWNGMGELPLRPADQSDRADKKLMQEVARLRDQMFDELSKVKGKTKDRVAWCKQWVEARQ